MMAKLYSYDIFDTLITRKVATPHGIFALMQSRLISSGEYDDIPGYLRNNFFNIRIASEWHAGKRAREMGLRDITIDEIYDVLGKAYGLNAKNRMKLMWLECMTERDQMVAIPDKTDEVFALKTEGNRVVLISDMYLKETMIRDILVSVDARFKDIPIYVSSEFRKRKDSGELFLAVKDEEKVDFLDWIHTGDNPNSDVRIPESLGIHTKSARGRKFLPIEKALLNKHDDDVYLQRLIGNSACLRQLRDIGHASNPLAFAYGTFYLPMITDGYIKWVLDQAEKQGIETLYFVARDGYLLKEMADWRIKKRNLSIKTRYIYGSRLTWRIPALSEENWIIKTICGTSDSVKYNTALDMAGVFGMDTDEFSRFLPKDVDEHTILGTPGKQYVAEYLENNAEFKKYLLESRAEDRRKMKAYLLQEINMNENFAFVELFGGGITQYQMAVVLYELGVSRTLNFYYHLSRDFSSEICEFQTYLPMGEKETSLLERFLSAPHGRTIGYEEVDGGTLKPVLDKESEVLSEYGHKDMRAGFEAFIENYDGIEVTPSVDVIEDFENYIKTEPDEDLLMFIGDMPVDASENVNDLYRFANKMNREELRGIYQVRAFEPITIFYSGLYFPYSWMRCSKEEKEWVNTLSKGRNLPDIERERDSYLNAKGLKRNYLVQYGFWPKIRGKRVALYGAGRFGGFIKEELLHSSDSEMVIWVDRNPVGSKSGGSSVKPIEALRACSFDYILIAIMSENIAQEAKNGLIVFGINEAKIIKPVFY